MKDKTKAELITEIETLRDQFQEAQANLDAIRNGEVDALVVSGPSGEQVFTLKEADRPYRIIIEEMCEGTVTLSEEGLILYSNKQLARMLGVPLAKLMGSSLYEFVRPRSRAIIQEVVSDSTIKSGRKEVLFEKSDGCEMHAYVSFSPLVMDQATVFCGVVTDITSEKKSREDLEKINALLENIFSNTHILMAYLDAELNFVRVNKSFAEVCGLPVGHFNGKNFFDLYEREDERAVFHQVMEKGEPYSAVDKSFNCFNNSGKEMHADWNLQPVKSADGQVQGVILTLIDRTERKLLEKERLMLEKAIGQAGDGIIVTDAKGVIEYVNEASGRISGYDRADTIGTPMGLLQGEGETSRGVRDALDREGLWKGHITGKRKDGTGCEVEATVSVVHNEQGQTLNHIVIEHDVTNEIKMEQQIRQMQKMEALGRLAGGIAHDLNNILYPIIINTEMLLDEEVPGTTTHQPLRQILTAAYRQRDLVRQILAFSRRSEQKLKPIKVGPVIKESLKFLRASLPSTIEIKQKIAALDDTILGDPPQVHQMIMNLCSNAADALLSQTGAIGIELDETFLSPDHSHPDIKPGRYLQLTVCDTGKGMSHEVLDHIFEPFYTTKEVNKGSGMGLAVVHGIVKSHRGAITVESKPGKGSRFVVYLPLLDRAYLHEKEEVVSGERVHEKRQILLVDDEGIVLNSVQRALERMGYIVTAEKDSEAALDHFRKSPQEFDLIITDQTMPRLTGVELSEEAMRIRPDMPVILCTGFSEVISEQEAKNMGIKELLMKPATTKDLGEAIHRALKG